MSWNQNNEKAQSDMAPYQHMHFLTRLQLVSVAVALLALLFGNDIPSSYAEVAARGSSAAISDPWQTENLISASELAALLSDSSAPKPTLLHIGIPALYQISHIPGSIFVGPASDPKILPELEREVKELERDQTIVLYCGCCPWKDCPNTRPAFRSLQKLGFMDVRVLYLPKNLQQDWIEKGFPIQKAAEAK